MCDIQPRVPLNLWIGSQSSFIISTSWLRLDLMSISKETCLKNRLTRRENWWPFRKLWGFLTTSHLLGGVQEIKEAVYGDAIAGGGNH